MNGSTMYYQTWFIVAYDIDGLILHHAVELEADNLSATQKPIIVQTHVHLITCPSDLESNQTRRVTVFCVTLSFPSSPDSVLLLKGIHHPYRLSHLSADLKRH